MKLHLRRHRHGATAEPHAESSESLPSEAIVVGVVARRDKSVGNGLRSASVDQLRAALADRGYADAAWTDIDRAKHAGKAVRELAAAGVNRVLVWGGDGTVRRSIQEAVDSKLARKVPAFSFGLLPAGTGNLLATNLGIPDSLGAALTVALTGRPRSIDVGEINGRCFAAMAGTGFDAVMIDDADRNGLKDRFGRAGYVWATLRNVDLEPVRTRVEVDGQAWFDGAATCVLVGNVGKLFGGLTAFPDADPGDGRLEFGIVQARRPSDWLRVGFGVAMHRASLSPFVTTTTGAAASIRLGKQRVWEADGGARPPTKRLDVRCRPAAVRICVPARRGN